MTWDGSKYHGPEARFWENERRYDRDAAYSPGETGYRHSVVCNCINCKPRFEESGSESDDVYDEGAGHYVGGLWLEDVAEPEPEPEPEFEVGQLILLLEVLTTRQRFVIGCRYGLIDGNCYTTREVADYMGITHQGVEAHEYDALRRMMRKVGKVSPL